MALKSAVAYYRTSSATNVGDDKDSRKRQADACHAYAKAAEAAIVAEFYDAAVSGTDMVEARLGFAEMMEFMSKHGVKTVLVESASRFARDHIVQALGHKLLKDHGIELIPVDAPTHFTDETPTAVMLRTIISAVSQYEKDALVLKLRLARDRKRRETGRCGGNPNWVPLPEEVIVAAHQARARGVSLREVSKILFAQGFAAKSGRPYGAGSVANMLRRWPQRPLRQSA